MTGVPLAVILSATFLLAGWIGDHLILAAIVSAVALTVAIRSRPTA